MRKVSDKHQIVVARPASLVKRKKAGAADRLSETQPTSFRQNRSAHLPQPTHQTLAEPCCTFIDSPRPHSRKVPGLAEEGTDITLHCSTPHLTSPDIC